MLRAAQIIVDYFGAAAQPMAKEHGIRYPVELEGLMLGRLANIDR